MRDQPDQYIVMDKATRYVEQEQQKAGEDDETTANEADGQRVVHVELDQEIAVGVESTAQRTKQSVVRSMRRIRVEESSVASGECEIPRIVVESVQRAI